MTVAFTRFLRGLFMTKPLRSRSAFPFEHLIAQLKPSDFPQDFEAWVLLNERTPVKVTHQGVSPSGRHRVKVQSTSQVLAVDCVYFSNPCSTLTKFNI